MDEVDNIIIQSLKQIGLHLESEDENGVFGLNNFSPDLLVRAVSRCLQEINRNIMLPNALPENMAQRFSVATSLAEECSSCGYRGDIGYQTFLYPNVVDIRRLFMFLIEQFPKGQQDSLNNTVDGADVRDDLRILMKEIKKKISMELKSPWLPQYCRGISNRKSAGNSSLTVDFLPKLNLHIPQTENQTQLKEISYQIPNIFQQSSSGEYDLVSSVLHKCAIDLYSSPPTLQGIRPSTVNVSQSNYLRDTKLNNLNEINECEDTGIEDIIPSTPLQSLGNEIESLTHDNDTCIRVRQKYSKDLGELRQKRSQLTAAMDIFKKQTKLHERTCVILENPTDNVEKLEGLIEKIRERRLEVESQWQQHRDPALKQIEDLQKTRKAKNLQNIQEIRIMIQDLESNLRDKTNCHGQFADELKKRSFGLANRKEYTRRIYEFIGNIRKQRNDIYKILDDTRDLQKQLNSVSAQLQRQFNYTDDLLFQSAKHDLHAKQAYKLLASLHASCNEICDMVSRTGQMTKESRDLEVQVDRENMRNVVSSLEKITVDIAQFELMIKSMQSEINTVENEIHTG